MRCANASPSSTCCQFQWRRNLDTCNLPLSRHGNFNVSIADHPNSSCKASHTRVRVERCSPMTPAASSSSSDINQPPHLASRASFAPLLRIRSYLPQARMGKDPMRAVFDQRRGINWQRQRHDRSCVGFAVPGAVGPKCLPGAAAACCWCSGYGWTAGVCLRVFRPWSAPVPPPGTGYHIRFKRSPPFDSPRVRSLL